MNYWRYKNIGIFQTEEECEQYKKFREDVLAHSYEFSDLEWKDENIPKHYIWYDYSDNEIETDYCYHNKYFGKIYFKTKEDAQYIIDKYLEELRKWKTSKRRSCPGGSDRGSRGPHSLPAK